MNALMRGLFGALADDFEVPGGTSRSRTAAEARTADGPYSKLADEVWALISLNDPAGMSAEDAARGLPSLRPLQEQLQALISASPIQDGVQADPPASTMELAEVVGPRVPLAEIPWWCVRAGSNAEYMNK